MAEALLPARYMMSKHVYFQHTRSASDYYSVQAIKSVLFETGENGASDKQTFAAPTFQKNMEEYLKWDDWRVIGMIHDRLVGENGRVLIERRHDRRVFDTPEAPDTGHLEFAQRVSQRRIGRSDKFCR